MFWLDKIWEFLKNTTEFLRIDISLPAEIYYIVSAALIILSLCSCFFGYRFFRFFMSLAGAFLGFAIGFLTTSLLYNGDKASLYSLLVGIAAAVLFSILSFKVYRLGLFIWAVVMAYGPVSSFISIDNFIARNVAAVAVSVLIAVFVVKFQYAWIIAVTAVAGGFNASAFLFEILPYEEKWPVYVTGAALALAGLVFQIVSRKNIKKNK